MGYTLEQFAEECRRALAAEPGREGRTKICAIVQDVLTDEAFIARHIADDAPERTVLYEDPQLGFCILAHNYRGARESEPHDHAHTWAIYGQASGETAMTDWEVLEKATADRPGKVRRGRTYRLTPGMAHVYHEGDVHSPRRDGATKLIRIEGTNMDRVKRPVYERA